MIIGNRYKIMEKIGEGNFGTIYKGKNIRTQELVAIKVESRSFNKKILKNEAKLYQYIGLKEGFIQMKWFAADNLNSYMVMDLLDQSLTEYKNKKTLSLNEVYSIGIQMINRIEVLHKNGLLHRDLKPDNFLFGLNDKKDILYLIDLGFCKRYMLDQNIHISNKINTNMIGTPLYVSLNVHKKGEPSRKDDIESIIFIMLFLIDKLEWKYLLDNNETTTKKIIEMKTNIITNDYIPIPIIEILKYCRILKFEECPDYEFIRNKLSNKQYKDNS